MFVHGHSFIRFMPLKGLDPLFNSSKPKLTVVTGHCQSMTTTIRIGHVRELQLYR